MSDIHELIERALAIHFSQNRQPHMSGDPRERLSALQRRNMEDARDAVIAALGIPVETLRGLRDGSLVAVPVGVIGEIAAERRRQIDAEGWSAEHDDQHKTGELARAAACYALHVGRLQHPRATWWPQHPPGAWPWDDTWWKPRDPRRDLIRAAALIVAEIERLDRTAAQEARDE